MMASTVADGSAKAARRKASGVKVREMESARLSAREKAMVRPVIQVLCS